MTGLPAETEEALVAIEEWLAKRPDGDHYTPSELREQASSLWALLASGGSGEAPAGVQLAIGTVARELRRLPTEHVARRDELADYLDAAVAALRGPVAGEVVATESGEGNGDG